MNQNQIASRTVSKSWDRAKTLANASGLKPAQTRNFISTYKGTNDEHTLHDYLDNNPTFQDQYGKTLLTTLARHRRHNNKPKTPKRQNEKRNQKRNQKPKTEEPQTEQPNDVQLIFALRDLQRTHGVDKVRQCLDALDILIR